MTADMRLTYLERRCLLSLEHQTARHGPRTVYDVLATQIDKRVVKSISGTPRTRANVLNACATLVREGLVTAARDGTMTITPRGHEAIAEARRRRQ